MANPEHIDILLQGVDNWNKWRKANPQIYPDLSECSIPEVLIKNSSEDRFPIKKSAEYYLSLPKDKIIKKVIDFSNVNFYKADMEAGCFPNANFEGSDFYEADLSNSLLCNANFRNCNFRKTYMAFADLTGAKIINANLNRASLVNSKLCGARIENCIVYGTSAWGLQTDKETFQRNLMIEDTNSTGDEIIEEVKTISGHYPMMVGDIEVAQFIHFIQSYSNLGKGLTAMLKKGVLLLGKFKDGGRETLEFVASEIRKKNLIPIIFDFDSPESSGLMDTVTVLAGISRFVIANLNGRSVPAELTRITANFNRPVITYIQSRNENKVYAMFKRDMLPKKNVFYFKYEGEEELSRKLHDKLIEAENQFKESNQNELDIIQQKLDNA